MATGNILAGVTLQMVIPPRGGGRVAQTPGHFFVRHSTSGLITYQREYVAGILMALFENYSKIVNM